MVRNCGGAFHSSAIRSTAEDFARQAEYPCQSALIKTLLENLSYKNVRTKAVNFVGGGSDHHE